MHPTSAIQHLSLHPLGCVLRPPSALLAHFLYYLPPCRYYGSSITLLDVYFTVSEGAATGQQSVLSLGANVQLYPYITTIKVSNTLLDDIY